MGRALAEAAVTSEDRGVCDTCGAPSTRSAWDEQTYTERGSVYVVPGPTLHRGCAEHAPAATMAHHETAASAHMMAGLHS